MPKYEPRKLMVFAGMVELMRPLSGFSSLERERLATTLAEIAQSIKEGAFPASTQRFLVEFEAEPRP